ncbi:Fungalysin/Thermolysin Propeptide Motif [Clostridium cavendishii DSM 21758]|uniref:Fungalysin/Thermolysin Propeptide Motif n=1 Tax=Clostridium cavendishii DSM 21758 TaxID=1121302 RepID=A0A1M6IW73_9CLOT|nr:hypothetical protein [Clostridium cavendishii]SHJ38662.1 Fungalysin/Thermolysin Propeptide Motif [Clostridium cavendishii DSM 21758]
MKTKTLIIIPLILGATICTSTSTFANANTFASETQNVTTSSISKPIINEGYLNWLIQNKSSDVKVTLDKENNTPSWIEGKLSVKPVLNSNEALEYLNNNKEALSLSQGEFEVYSVVDSKNGYTYKAQFTIQGMVVYGTQVFLHTDKNGNVTSINGNILPIPLRDYTSDVNISKKAAIYIANTIPENYSDINAAEARLCLYKENGQVRVTYLVYYDKAVNGINPNWNTIIDATDGHIVKHTSVIFTQS